ncbi:unnamed protein product [Prorocentrum cordatum]|uniref:Uncharacterized protein n=1 Tax=Prorocentrum cordatum TaxID=2364126 RepID=A0ABN9WJH5_9DINO|nr:unnamed protein product [Polarella glacialis]
MAHGYAGQAAARHAPAPPHGDGGAGQSTAERGAPDVADEESIALPLIESQSSSSGRGCHGGRRLAAALAGAALAAVLGRSALAPLASLAGWRAARPQARHPRMTSLTQASAADAEGAGAASEGFSAGNIFDIVATEIEQQLELEQGHESDLESRRPWPSLGTPSRARSSGRSSSRGSSECGAAPAPRATTRWGRRAHRAPSSWARPRAAG